MVRPLFVKKTTGSNYLKVWHILLILCTLFNLFSIELEEHREN